MPKKDELVDAAKEAIDEVFGDTSVSKETTMERMKDLRSHIDDSMTSLREDIKREEEE
jgi:hypothetical protein